MHEEGLGKALFGVAKAAVVGHHSSKEARGISDRRRRAEEQESARELFNEIEPELRKFALEALFCPKSFNEFSEFLPVGI